PVLATPAAKSEPVLAAPAATETPAGVPAEPPAEPVTEAPETPDAEEDVSPAIGPPADTAAATSDESCEAAHSAEREQIDGTAPGAIENTGPAVPVEGTQSQLVALRDG